MSDATILLVTSWGVNCGIADHSAQLKDAVSRVPAGKGLTIVPSSEALDPGWVFNGLSDLVGSRGYDLIHLNHHDALHSRWTAAHVDALVRQWQIPVLVTYHDTRERLADCPKLAALAAVASSVVVHEPVEGLHAIVWRQAIPAPAALDYTPALNAIRAFPQQPILGTAGFHFPWKNYDRLAHITGEEGWGLVICAANATPDDCARWRARNPALLCHTHFQQPSELVNWLAACDATAYMYECANTGTSGAIRFGIAARKPVIALESCRQFRDLLLLDPLLTNRIDWVADWAGFRRRLQMLRVVGRRDTGVHALAEQDSWVKCGTAYAQLYRMLMAKNTGQTAVKPLD